MALDLPGSIEGTCDGCGETETFDATEYTGSPRTVGVEESEVSGKGWWLTDGDELFCPDCKHENGYEEEEDG